MKSRMARARPCVALAFLAIYSHSMMNTQEPRADNETLDAWLADFLARNGGTSGTVHLSRDGGLRLAAAVNIPEKVRQIVAWVPWGKGMAGLALERGVPIQTCNLKEDESGAVKPGARAVDAKAAVAIPVKSENNAVRAVVGIAFPDERQFSASDLAALSDSAATLPW
jgi:L-methionine (R)-S-oxide reductase